MCTMCYWFNTIFKFTWLITSTTSEFTNVQCTLIPLHTLHTWNNKHTMEQLKLWHWFWISMIHPQFEFYNSLGFHISSCSCTTISSSSGSFPFNTWSYTFTSKMNYTNSFFLLLALAPDKYRSYIEIVVMLTILFFICCLSRKIKCIRFAFRRNRMLLPMYYFQ